MFEDLCGTKAKIFQAALELFSLESYHAVSLRDIAKRAGIKVSSIYNHYGSKDDILVAIYEFYDGQMAVILPDLEVALAMVETHHPHDVLRYTYTVFPEEIMPEISMAMQITSSLAHTDTRADHLAHKHMIEIVYQYDRPILDKMIKLNKIEPLDVDHFILIHSSYLHSAAVRSYSDRQFEDSFWLSGLDMVFSLVKAKEPAPVTATERESA